MTNNNVISDDEWLAILNGSQEAEPDSSQQQQVKALREAILMAEVTDEYLAEERVKILRRLPKREAKLNLWQKIIAYVQHQPQKVAWGVALVSLMLVAIPLLINTSVMNKTELDNDRYILRKGGNSSAVMWSGNGSLISSKSVLIKAQEIKTAFEAQGLLVQLAQQDKAWILTTELPLDLADRPKVIKILSDYNIELPLDSRVIKLMFKEL